MYFKQIVLSTSLILIGVSIIVLMSGCQTSGEVLSMESSIVCPNCMTETRSSPFKGINYKKHICPDCRTEKVMDESGEISPWEDVHVCDRCDTIVEECPLCEGK